MSQNPVKEALEGAYYYEDKSVSRTRKNKSCDFCSATIPSGSSHKGATIFNDEFIALVWCNDCNDKYANELSAMRNAEYDSY